MFPEYDTIRILNGLVVVKGEIADDRSGYSHKNISVGNY